MSPIAPSHGMRALVTRPREEAEALAAVLAARGIDAVIEPMLQICYRDVAPLDLAGVQAFLCTSGNGVEALARATSERRLPLLAVGAATAARARGAGFFDVTSAAGDVGDLVRLAAERLRPEDGKLLHAAGSVVAGDLAGALNARGYRVERQILYEARPAEALTSTTLRALRGGSINFALFFSPRSAAVFGGLVTAAGMAQSCATIAAVSISAAADAALAQLPWWRREVAARPDQAALLEALEGMLTGHCAHRGERA